MRNGQNMLTQEYGTGAFSSSRLPHFGGLMTLSRAASNIKSRVNRLSVLGAITSTQQRLKLCTSEASGRITRRGS